MREGAGGKQFLIVRWGLSNHQNVGRVCACMVMPHLQTTAIHWPMVMVELSIRYALVIAVVPGIQIIP